MPDGTKIDFIFQFLTLQKGTKVAKKWRILTLFNLADFKIFHLATLALPGIFPSRGFSHPGDFVVPGILQSWGFCHPEDFPCLPEVPHALLGLPMPSLACTNATFPIMGAITCIALALYLNFF